jgi:asparagine synthase (glutamine-hydrolysing)
MYRIVAFVWDPMDAAASGVAVSLRSKFVQTAESWDCCLEATGTVVFGRRSRRPDFRRYDLAGGAGVVLGRVFAAGGERPTLDTADNFDDATTQLILRSSARHLTEQYWGNYIAFINDARTHRTFVLRDSSGTIPCYYLTRNGVRIVFSEISDVLHLDIGRLTINWPYLSAFICAGELEIHDTGLIEVKEVLAGECLVVSSGTDQLYPHWDPRQISRADPIDDYEAAVTELRDVTQRCVQAWASVQNDIIHNLSGGFDSAVVLGCLSRAVPRPKITCVNRYYVDVSSDERVYARLAATRANLKLREQPFDESDNHFDESILGMPRTSKPTVPFVFNMPDMRVRNTLARSVNAEAVWTGQGGDHLFFQMGSPLGIADYIHYHGFGTRLPAVIDDAARLSKNSYFGVMRAAASALRPKGPWVPEPDWNRHPSFVNQDSLPRDASDFVTHPWDRGADDLPKGKRYQIHVLAELMNRQRPNPCAELAAEHHPLMSQPIIELCLRIPIYLLVRGGRQRSLARDAFADRVPVEILNREDKGGTTAYILRSIRNSEKFLCNLILGGQLAGERIINAKALEPYLRGGRPIRVEQFASLLACVAGEVWVRRWCGHASAKAA